MWLHVRVESPIRKNGSDQVCRQQERDQCLEGEYGGHYKGDRDEQRTDILPVLSLSKIWKMMDNAWNIGEKQTVSTCTWARESRPSPS